MSRINNLEYRNARRLVRENGYYALRWMTCDTASVMAKLRCINDETDHLAERASIIAYCKRVGAECNARHTASRHEAAE